MNHSSNARREQLPTRSHTTIGQERSRSARRTKSSSLVDDRAVMIERELPDRAIVGRVQSKFEDVIGLLAKLDEQPAQGGRQLRVDHEPHGAAAGRIAWSA
jgi:hypothetical protein